MTPWSDCCPYCKDRFKTNRVYYIHIQLHIVLDITHRLRHQWDEDARNVWNWLINWLPHGGGYDWLPQMFVVWVVVTVNNASPLLWDQREVLCFTASSKRNPYITVWTGENGPFWKWWQHAPNFIQSPSILREGWAAPCKASTTSSVAMNRKSIFDCQTHHGCQPICSISMSRT